MNIKFYQWTKHLSAAFLLILIFAVATAAQWQKQMVGTKESLHGLSVVNQNVVWASGTNGTFVRTTDGGKTWEAGFVPNAEKLDFRDVQAFDANTAYLLSIGNGDASRIYKTTNGGKTWALQFKNTNEKVFLDAFAFWDSAHGIAMGDPVDGKFYLLTTSDGGNNWKELPTAKMPNAIAGEAAFAASGTCVITSGKSAAFLVSGGNAARVFYSINRGANWAVAETPITKGTAGSGIFSIAMSGAKTGVIVGGNYEKPNETTNNLALTNDAGRTWTLGKGLSNYRSGVAFVFGQTLIAVGSSGSDISVDGGKTWKILDKENYNSVAVSGDAAALDSKTIWAVGANGLVAKKTMARQY